MAALNLIKKDDEPTEDDSFQIEVKFHFAIQPDSTTETTSLRLQDGIQKLLNSIRKPEEHEDDDVVYVETFPANTQPPCDRTTAVIELNSDDESIPETRRRTHKRRRRTGEDTSPAPNCSNVSRKRQRRQQTKAESSVNVKPKIVPISSPVTLRTAVNGSRMSELTCAVCMESMLCREPTSTTCGHIFCQSCITKAINLTKKCPLCGRGLQPVNVHRVYF